VLDWGAEEVAASELFHFQAGDQLEVSDVVRGHRITELNCASSDDQIGQGKDYSFGCQFAADPSHDFSSGFGHRVDGDVRLQLIQELTAVLRSFWLSAR
jgi:hypothetical protein